MLELVSADTAVHGAEYLARGERLLLVRHECYLCLFSR